MAIGNDGTGVSSRIKVYDRRGEKWPEKLHSRYISTIMTDEYMSTQLWAYCYFPIVRPRRSDYTKVLGTLRYPKPDCPAFKHGGKLTIEMPCLLLLSESPQ
ncbi:hypothetical protein BDF21DRAFT_474797 [Thamnidium elegans]|uniref:Uncharacterized protein n=1 Tax=Thamnidium elegans TaxID=101142 RepID=A0A8H7W019_9FUNG|nr:hypothetical protein INT48_003175 [Thamnidium elegans]KAI8075739.1 hypothetical protein BDF21DRAFT_474797 [Thamnidium elegans]